MGWSCEISQSVKHPKDEENARPSTNGHRGIPFLDPCNRLPRRKRSRSDNLQGETATTTSCSNIHPEFLQGAAYREGCWRRGSRHGYLMLSMDNAKALYVIHR